ncbi:extracellular solute-binding protein [Streptomyces triticagri]|uniref:Extracellular solute-binding protein n=1 Tax=Streptomyces triticagri TaxID=2293568 RepID=A0A372M0N0_9ACTN|nr:extracellular solute-binding protein [Streptomyces triticagri]RFU84379.1 extracellular solute-binding protein [Streptomyces triticagri]
MTVPHRLSRRTFVGGALLGASALTGCSTVSRSTDVAAINKPAELPVYRRWKGAEPDLPTVNPLVPDAYLRYPRTTERAYSRKPGDGSEVKGSVAINTPIPPPPDRNRYWQELNARTNLNLGLTITPHADHTDKFQTQVAGDALGDIWTIPDRTPYLPQLLEAKAQDLTPYLSGRAILKYPFLASIPTDSWRGCVFSGRIFALPVPRGALSALALLVRADLFRERGVDPEFSTVDELMSVARSMSDDRNNRWAFASVPTSILCTMMGISNDWAEHGGKLTYFKETEEWLEVLDISRRMVREKLAHPDGITSYNGKAWFQSGAVSMMQDTYSALAGLYQQAKGDFEIGLPIVPGPDGAPAKPWYLNPNNAITGVSRAAPERIEMLLDFLNWCSAPIGTDEYTFRKYGIEGIHHTVKDGDPRMTAVGNSETGLGDFPIQYLTESPKPLYLPGFPDGTKEMYRNLKAVTPGMKPGPVHGLYSPTSSKKGELLGKFIDDTTNDVLLGRAKVSAWPETVRRWRRRGGDAMRAEYEQALEVKAG